ncbi:hypothetical protein QVD17_31851 [Tagetes erecta]|uniref:Uncharacterized protein n=1 Tax=Tagetes erecta TaxID=13708 RepID=A0AAD8K6E6_TARER|nr:hypothetical protein QVD17_31851 [Tagetes erecta]
MATRVFIGEMVKEVGAMMNAMHDGESVGRETTTYTVSLRLDAMAANKVADKHDEVCCLDWSNEWISNQIST